MQGIPTNITGLPLANLDSETEKAPETRIAHAAIGRQIFQNMRYDDRLRNQVRARQQAMLDGEPPYDQALRAAKGQGALTNVNWGDAKNVMENFMGGMIDLDSVEVLMNIPMPRHVIPHDDTRFNYENICAQELTRMIRAWEGYEQNRLILAHWFGGHGVGIAYFEDDKDWRFTATGFGDFVIPNDTPASEDMLECAGVLRYMPLHKMYSYIRNPKAAEQRGWNVEMVKRAMMRACPESVWNGLPPDWQRLEMLIRNNDMGTGYGYGGYGAGDTGRTSKVALIHLWCQEFDGKVTKYITTLDAIPDYQNKPEPWLYAKESIYPEMRRGMMFFPYGIGDNGTYYAISGILRAIFPQIKAINRAQSHMLDAAMMGCAMKIQPLTEASMSRMKVVPLGPIWLMPSVEHGQIVEQRNPDVAQSVMPVIADLRSTVSARAGQFQGDNSPIGSPVEKTRFQVAAELDALGKVGATQEKLWNAPWTRLLREIVRRVCAESYPEQWPGGKEVAEFKRRLMEKGVDTALLKYIDFDGITANRAVGSGSGAARIGRLESLRQLAPEMDDVGRYNLNRDLTAATLGGDYDAANRYMPERPGSRPPVDVQFADLENSLMKLSEEPTIEVNQDGFAHLSRHVPFLGKLIESVEKGEAELEEVIEPMVICYYHCADTLEQVEQSQIMQELVAQYRQTIQQMGAFVVNAQRKIIAEQMRAAEKAQEEGAQGDQMDPVLQEKAIAARIKLESMQQQHALQMEMDAERFSQEEEQKQLRFTADMARADAKGAADLIVGTQKQLQELRVHEKQKDNAMELAKIKAKSKPKPAKKK